MKRVRADLGSRPRGTRSVVLAHAFVAGAQPSESERDISVGGVSLVPTTAFDGSRLRRARPPPRPHTLDRADPLQRLSAGLLLLRGRHRKGLGWSTSTRADSPGRVRRRPGAPRLARLRGSLDELLADPRHSAHKDVVAGGDPDRPGASAPTDGAAAAPIPARVDPGLRAGRARATASRPGGAGARSTTRSPTTSSGRLTRHARHRGEVALLPGAATPAARTPMSTCCVGGRRTLCVSTASRSLPSARSPRP